MWSCPRSWARGSAPAAAGFSRWHPLLGLKTEAPHLKMWYVLVLIMRILNQAHSPSLKEQFLLKTTGCLMTRAVINSDLLAKPWSTGVLSGSVSGSVGNSSFPQILPIVLIHGKYLSVEKWAIRTGGVLGVYRSFTCSAEPPRGGGGKRRGAVTCVCICRVLWGLAKWGMKGSKGARIISAFENSCFPLIWISAVRWKALYLQTREF